MNHRKNTKNIVLALVLILVVVAIVLISIHKPRRLTPENAADIAIPALPAVSSQKGTDNSPGSVQKNATALDRRAVISKEAQQYPRGKELAGISGYINTQPFTLADLVAKNKVILVDFWTYSCINCQRTIPYLNAWYQKYKDQGLVIVGVSAPEFGFEKDPANVAAAVKRLGITYPVVLDNDMQTWDAYRNEYWPAEYLIDSNGFVIHTNFGEGDYGATEQAIQAALRARDAQIGVVETIPTGLVNPASVVTVDSAQVQSPETYFGAKRNEYLANGTQGSTGIQTLSVPANIGPNQLYLGGTWSFQSEFSENAGPSDKIVFQYGAKNVYFVASSKQGTRIKVLIDGKDISPSMRGADVSSDGTVLVKADRLYHLVSDATGGGQHTLELDVQGQGLDAYTFTFG